MSDDKDRFDRWIDEGVERYAQAEPPLGLEARVLAALEQPHPRTWWRPWMVAVPVAALLAIVIGLAVQNKKEDPPTPAVGLGGSEKARVVVSIPTPPSSAVGPLTRRLGKALRPVPAATGGETRPQQFPSLVPATEQEKLLARLAQNRAEAQTAAARTAQEPEEVVISGIAIKPVEIPLLPGPPQGE